MILASSAHWVLAGARERLGNPYVYGGVYSPTDLREGADCSGVAGWVLEALTSTPRYMSWAHVVSTESWYYDYPNNTPASPGSIGPFGTIAVADLGDIPADAALTVNIMHGGGGADSHMNVCLNGTLIESNGSHGSCTNGSGAYPNDASLWTDHWYLPGPVVEGSTVSTLFYPDVSNVNWGGPAHTLSGAQSLLTFLASAKVSGMAGVMHKVSQGSGFADPYWPAFRQWCENNDMSWLGYHYVDTSDPTAQAQNFTAHNGGAWAMLDFEGGAGNWSNFWAVVNAFNTAGVDISMAYVPQWYWSQIGQPDLSSLAANQISLVSSNYPGGSGPAGAIYAQSGAAAGAGWLPYGGAKPTSWQFTDQANVGAFTVDANAYLGPGPNLNALFTGNIF